MKTHEEKTIQYGGGGEKQKEDNEARSSNEITLWVKMKMIVG